MAAKSNPKNVYSRDFLLQLRTTMPPMKAPVLDSEITVGLSLPCQFTVSKNSSSSKQSPDKTPAQKPVNVTPRQHQKDSNTSPNFGNWRSACRNRTLDTIFENEVSLHKTKSAWKKQLSKDETEEVLKKMQGLLNKLAPENFDKIMSQVIGLQIDAVDKLDGCLCLLFEKAVLEPSFSQTYARMAHNLANLKVIDTDQKEVTARTLLIRKCQKEFERDKKNESVVSELTEKIKNARTNDKKKELTEERAMAIFKSKKRSLGNIKFIGELFKLGMLTEGTMISCISQLMNKESDEESLESLCKLLTTIGKTLEKESKVKVNMIMDKLSVLGTKKSTSARIKFMIMDLVDLRKAEWVPKRNEGPKTIAQVHQDAEQEKLRGAVAFTPNRHCSRSYEPMPTERRRSPPQNNFAKRYDTGRLSANSDSWRSRAHDETSSKQNSITDQNRSSFVKNYSHCDREVSTDVKSVESPSVSKISKTPSIDKDFHKLEITPRRRQEAIPRIEMERKVKSRIEEFLSLKDMKEALETVKELKLDNCFKNAVRFFYISISQNFEKSSMVREEIGTLHRHILENHIAPVKAYADAWIKFSKFANELIIDIPQVWNYVSEIIAPVILDFPNFKMSIFTLKDGPDSELDEDLSEDGECVAKLMASILNGISKCRGEAESKRLWDSTGLKWEILLKNTSTEEFKKKYLRI